MSTSEQTGGDILHQTGASLAQRHLQPAAQHFLGGDRNKERVGYALWKVRG